MPSGSRFITASAVLLCLSGCATDDVMIKRQSEAEAKIEYLIQNAKKSEQRNNDIAGQLQAHDERFTSLSGELKQLREENRELQAFQSELKSKVTSAVQQAQTPKVEIVNQAPPKTAREAGPPAEYLKAFGLYSANNFQVAIESFESFVKNNPQSDYAANALYWIGECHYSLSDLVKARDAFAKVSEVYPKSPKVPDAMLKHAFALAALKEKDKATAVFQKIITSYPSSPAAVKARERLNAH